MLIKTLKIRLKGLFFFGLTLCFGRPLFSQPTKHTPVGGRLDADMFVKASYEAEGNAFVCHNSKRFNNRPLYSNQSPALVITGDRPLIRFGNGQAQNGTFIAALLRGNNAKWLHNFSDITAKYRSGRMEWWLKDAALGSTTLILEAVTLANGTGATMHMRIENAQPGDKLVWVCGGTAEKQGGMQAGWDITTSSWSVGAGNSKKMLMQFSPDECIGNHISVNPDGFILQGEVRKVIEVTTVHCSVPSIVSIVDAAEWSDPSKIFLTKGTDKPLACAVTSLDGRNEIFWSMLVQDKKNDSKTQTVQTPAATFAAGMKRVVDVENRVVVKTPDARLNAQVAAANAAIDGVFREGIYTHSGMRWGVPLLGWRTIYGGTNFGWHNRVKVNANLAIAKQITKDVTDRLVPKPDVRYGLTSQAPDSKMFGKGRVDFHQPSHYDMQTQFFDQLIHSWRFTGDPELEKLLRPALELHLDYIHDNFDPDDDGLYESYANTWPTDDQWYNGGGTAEETAYAYAAEKAVVEMARRAGDAASIKKHEQRVAKIYKNFMAKLWVPNKDYVGAWVEQGGHERLHEDCWLYATFCPIDAGMLNTQQAAQSLYYSEWGLEREKMSYGGQRCWTSNWVPSKWSLREMWPGDSYGLALAYFQNGQASEGWELLRGTFPAMSFYGPVPADLGHPNGGTDFNDCASMFCRSVVEGLFGYRPDYPNGVVTIAPQLPAEWKNSSIRTPDFSVTVEGNKYRIALIKGAALDLRLPIRARKVTNIKVNGKSVKWELLPGFGCSIAKIILPKGNSANVEISVEQPLPQYDAITMQTNVGAKVNLTPKDAVVTKVGEVPTTPGYHLVDEIVKVGDAPQRRVFKIKLIDPAADAALAAKTLKEVPANSKWVSVDMSKKFNGDVRTIFKQQYLSPRPNTSSLRLSTDGYSTWQMMLGTNTTGEPNPSKAPLIDLSNVPRLTSNGNELMTKDGVPFAWSSTENNISFTSMWDNWPRQVNVPVNKKGEAVYFLVCGFTNPMQGRITNAVISMKYSDGVVEKLEIVPPLNFWSLCNFAGSDYDYKRDWFSLPNVPPTLVQLGNNCRAILMNRRLRLGATLESVSLETLSQEVMIGLMGVTIMNPDN